MQMRICLLTLLLFLFTLNKEAVAENASKSALDSEKYFNEIFKINDISKITDDQLKTLQNMSSDEYKILGNIITMNSLIARDPKANASQIDDIFNKSMNLKTDSVFKDYVVFIYSKILLNQGELDKFRDLVLAKLSDKSFTLQDSSLELIAIYHRMMNDGVKIDLKDKISEDNKHLTDLYNRILLIQG
jgi:hypothetical protein